MKQPELTLNAPLESPRSVGADAAGALGDPEDRATSDAAPKASALPCQNPGCPHHIVPADASDERCPDCGHAIRDEEVMCNESSVADSTRPTMDCADTATGASHKRPAKAPASPPDPASPRSIAARILELAKALGVRSDAEAKNDLPF